ncbi:proline-rich extensin-like protein EPR1 [Folsomia candida]|uniref:proline-rich extensin-like protein EPR1 n=1 Tax=Folsomia candida TaxID=158441 RepID=UPI000B8FEABE|nr:proline-rich extensin-like protein EPR1 [Folsomia candida]
MASQPETSTEAEMPETDPVPTTNDPVDEMTALWDSFTTGELLNSDGVAMDDENPRDDLLLKFGPQPPTVCCTDWALDAIDIGHNVKEQHIQGAIAEYEEKIKAAGQAEVPSQDLNSKYDDFLKAQEEMFNNFYAEKGEERPPRIELPPEISAEGKENKGAAGKKGKGKKRGRKSAAAKKEEEERAAAKKIEELEKKRPGRQALKSITMRDDKSIELIIGGKQLLCRPSRVVLENLGEDMVNLWTKPRPKPEQKKEDVKKPDDSESATAPAVTTIVLEDDEVPTTSAKARELDDAKRVPIYFFPKKGKKAIKPVETASSEAPKTVTTSEAPITVATTEAPKTVATPSEAPKTVEKRKNEKPKKQKGKKPTPAPPPPPKPTPPPPQPVFKIPEVPKPKKPQKPPVVKETPAYVRPVAPLGPTKKNPNVPIIPPVPISGKKRGRPPKVQPVNKPSLPESPPAKYSSPQKYSIEEVMRAIAPPTVPKFRIPKMTDTKKAEEPVDTEEKMTLVYETPPPSMPTVAQTPPPSMPTVAQTPPPSMPTVAQTLPPSMPTVAQTPPSSMPILGQPPRPPMPTVAKVHPLSIPSLAPTIRPSMRFVAPTHAPSMPKISQTPLIPIVAQTPLIPIVAQTPRSPMLTVAQTPLIPIISQTPLIPIVSQTPLIPIVSQTPLIPIVSQTTLIPIVAQTPPQNKESQAKAPPPPSSIETSDESMMEVDDSTPSSQVPAAPSVQMKSLDNSDEDEDVLDLFADLDDDFD